MTTPKDEHHNSQCDCYDEQHKLENRQMHRHLGDECVHTYNTDDGT